MSEEKQKETSEQSPPGEPGIPGSSGGRQPRSAAEKLALIAVGFHRTGGREQAELYLLEQGPDSWRVAGSIDLDFCAF